MVVGLDDCDGSRHALAWALGNARKTASALVVVHVTPLGAGMAYASFVPGLVAVRREIDDDITMALAGEAAAEALRLGLDLVFENRQGDPATELIDVVRQRAADLLVVGACRSTWWSRLRWGSVGSRLARQHQVPVVVVP